MVIKELPPPTPSLLRRGAKSPIRVVFVFVLICYNESMFEVFFKIWYFVVILPFIIFLEGSDLVADFLKKRNMYLYWDVWHSYLFVLILLLIFLWMDGFR